MIEVLMCSEQWLKADIKFCENVQTNENILAEVEMLDKLEKGMFLFLLVLLTFYMFVCDITYCFVSRFRVRECDN